MMSKFWLSWERNCWNPSATRSLRKPTASKPWKPSAPTPTGFDLVITDMTMPGLRGEELARQIIALRPGMPIILCTGYSDLIDEKLAREIGIREFVMKPYVVANFVQTIRKALKTETN